LLKLGHVALSVADLNRSAAFYQKHFGLKCREKYRIGSLGLSIAILKKDNITLELFKFKGYKPLPIYRRTLDSDLRTLGAKHFSFTVADIEKFYRKFKRARVKFATPIRIFENGRKYFFIQDPDGILVEIMESL